MCVYVRVHMYIGILFSAEGADQCNFSMFFTQGTELPKSF
jgi:hypothetical protein